MKNDELKDRILSELNKTQFGASTRFLCDKIFGEKIGGHFIWPGKEKMQQVYRQLGNLKKSGRVENDYPGHWKAKRPKISAMTFDGNMWSGWSTDCGGGIESLSDAVEKIKNDPEIAWRIIDADNMKIYVSDMRVAERSIRSAKVNFGVDIPTENVFVGFPETEETPEKVKFWKSHYEYVTGKLHKIDRGENVKNDSVAGKIVGIRQHLIDEANIAVDRLAEIGNFDLQKII